MPANTHSIRPIFSAFRNELAARRELRARRRQVWAELSAYRTPGERIERDILLGQMSEEELGELMAGKA